MAVRGWLVIWWMSDNFAHSKILFIANWVYTSVGTKSETGME